MARDLKGVIRYRKWIVDEKRRVLSMYLDREQEIIDYGLQLDREEEEQRMVAGQHAYEGGRSFAAWATMNKERRVKLAAALVEIRRRIEEAQDDLSDSFKELKTFEIAQENRETAEQAERDRKTQLQMDEIGLEQFRRRDPS